MFPYFTLFGRIISMYAVMALIGIFASGYYLCTTARPRSLDENEVITLSLYICLGIFLGSHLLYALVNHQTVPALFQQHDFTSFYSAFYTTFGGSVFYGGLIGGIITAFIYLRLKHMPISTYADLFAPAAPLFHGFARIGCFLSGCCYGIESSFGITYTSSLVSQANGVCRFPVQLLESGLNFVFFLVLALLYRKKRMHGQLFLLYIVLYSVARFGDEFLRGDLERGIWGPFSTSQWLSIILFIIVISILLYSKKGKQRRL